MKHVFLSSALFLSFQVFSPLDAASVELPAFSAASGTNAYDYVAGLVGISPRDAGTAGAAYASQWIAQRLRDAGLTPHADVWREARAGNPSVQFCNVWAEIPGTSGKTVVFGSHFDTKSGIENFKGANDGGSSTGILLEMARLLKASGRTFRHTIRFAFFDGEECEKSYDISDGLHGSRKMAEDLLKNPGKGNVAAVVVLDMVGDRHLNVQLPRNVTPWLATLVLDASFAVDQRLGGNSGALTRIAETYIVDDHWPFVERGFSAVDLIDFDYGSKPGLHDYWHTSEDTLDKLSPASLTKMGQLAMEILRRLEESKDR